MKTKKGILAFTLMFSLSLVIALGSIAAPSSADIIITSPDNHYLNDAKSVDVCVLSEDENGKITYDLCNLYERETKRRSEPLSEYFIDNLVEMGVGKERASSLTVGEYEDYIYNLPMKEEYIPLLKHYGVSQSEYAEWTNMDAENYLYHKNGEVRNQTEKAFTDEQIEKVNALGITLDEFKTLMNMSFSVDEITEMTKEDAKTYLGRR